MGRMQRERPKHLAKKLRQIRLNLGLSQNEMLNELGLSNKVYRSAVSGYELGTREPTLIILLRYARLAGVSTDNLIDDRAALFPESSKKTDDKSKTQSGRGIT